jgi:hypothetical protein
MAIAFTTWMAKPTPAPIACPGRAKAAAAVRLVAAIHCGGRLARVNVTKKSIKVSWSMPHTWRSGA